MTQSRGKKILLVEDDENIRLALTENLIDEGYAARSAETATEARSEIGDHEPDLVLLDIMLPDGDGYELCREIRASGSRVGIIMLTARTLEEDLVRGFTAGADDYVTKPYRLAELFARITAVLRRRTGSQENDPAHLPGFSIDRPGRQIHDANNKVIELTRTEFDLLMFFYDNAGRALSRDEILDNVWPEGMVVEPRTVDNFVSSLRQKLNIGQGSVRVSAVRGIGYRMEISKG